MNKQETDGVHEDSSAPETLAAWEAFEEGGEIIDLLKHARRMECERNAMKHEAMKHIQLWHNATKELEILKFGPESRHVRAGTCGNCRWWGRDHDISPIGRCTLAERVYGQDSICIYRTESSSCASFSDHPNVDASFTLYGVEVSGTTIGIWSHGQYGWYPAGKWEGMDFRTITL
jgi:hypothetical protein